MRSNDVMMKLILDTAKKDERVRAVLMNGSRVNKNAKKDIFQDYDIVYVVRDINTYLCNHSWIDIFGDRIMLQMPEAMEYPPAKNDGRFNYLMLFTDGNRIDLTLLPRERVDELYEEDSLTKLLLDKDQIFTGIDDASDIDYWITKPYRKQFEDLCNEFLWLTTNVAKGLWREELTYSKFMYGLCHDILIDMIKWSIGVRIDFKASVGKLGKNMQNYLSDVEWEELQRTYVGYMIDDIWSGLIHMTELFNKYASALATELNYSYPYQDYCRVSDYLNRVKVLPGDAVTI